MNRKKETGRKELAVHIATRNDLETIMVKKKKVRNRIDLGHNTIKVTFLRQKAIRYVSRGHTYEETY